MTGNEDNLIEGKGLGSKTDIFVCYYLLQMGHMIHIETMGRPFGCKLVRLSADIEDGIIRSLSIRGDFFASPEAGFDAAERRMAGVALSDAAASFDSFLNEEGVEAFGIHGEGIAGLLAAAVQYGNKNP